MMGWICRSYLNGCMKVDRSCGYLTPSPYLCGYDSEVYQAQKTVFELAASTGPWHIGPESAIDPL